MRPGSPAAPWVREKVRSLCSALLPSLLASAVLAQEPLPTAKHVLAVAAESPAPRGPTDPAEIEAFLDGLLGALLTEEQVAGAAVSIVRDGRLLFSKGYGWADVEARIPVDPATTLFRIGSVSKLFTWTAVMQLRDEGRLDLDADINQYLDFRLPGTFADPITLRHLMTHTPGFEDRNFRLFAPDERMPRGEWLRRNVPARVRPPGQDVAYSNYGSALAGYIVERVSGLTWEEYIERHIFGPLGMRSATGRQPPPGQLAASASRGHVQGNGRFAAQPFDWIAPPLAPAGAVSASAEAMGRFMIAHLRTGQSGVAALLSDSALARMHGRSFGPAPRLNGWALGFYEKSSHSLRIIGHGGGTQHFFSDLSLVPAEGLGIFVSFNSPGRNHLLTRRFLDAFLDHYYPVAPLGRAEPAPGWTDRARRFSGSYLPLRRSYTTLEKLVGATQTIHVVPGGPGELVLRFPERTERVHEVAPAYFETADRSFAVAFGEGAAGRRRLYLGVGSVTAEQVPAWQTYRLHLPLFAASLLLLGSVVLLVPIRFALQWQGARLPPLRGPERGLRWAALGFALLSLAFVGAIAWLFADPDGYTTGSVEPVLRGTLLLPLLSLPLAAVVLAGAVLAFRRGYWTRWGRLHYALVAAAVLTFVVQLQFWNLLGWHL